jgi:uncharacterized protein YaaQ
MNNRLTIQRLILAVIQVQDVENATQALNTAGLYVTRISSSGAFLGLRNVTLLIGVAENQEQTAIDILNANCRRRVEYLVTRLEGAPFHLPLTTSVTVGGATVFSLKVDHWEEVL